ncbi:AMP-binding protein, partial [Paraburkholderia aspalathi]|uniref:AMP-binding protein n=1 Tax=Paraburkholderia aspalathi TaxID=1324617 RepID=UPI0038BB3792
ERSQVVEGFNQTAQAYPEGVLIQSLFEEQARVRPQAVALECEGQRLGYAALNGRANRLARHLRSLGVGPDVLVALCVERSLEMVVALLATLKAGGAYVPLDPGYPAGRLGYMLRDAAPAVVLVDAVGLMALGEENGQAQELLAGQQVVHLGQDENVWAGQPEENL